MSAGFFGFVGKIKIKITKISSVVLQKANGFLRILDVATIHVLLLVLIFFAVFL